MGCVQFFCEELKATNGEVESAVVSLEPCEVSVWDNHLKPEIRIKALDGTNKEVIATFPNIEQFVRFVEAVDGLRSHHSVDERVWKKVRKEVRKVFETFSPDGKTIRSDGMIHTLQDDGTVTHEPIDKSDKPAQSS